MVSWYLDTMVPNISKSWLITILPMLFALGFALQIDYTGKDIPDQEITILDNFLLPAFGISAGTGAALSGHRLYQSLKNPSVQTLLDSGVSPRDISPKMIPAAVSTLGAQPTTLTEDG